MKGVSVDGNHTCDKSTSLFASRVLEGDGVLVTLRIYCPQENAGGSWMAPCELVGEDGSVLWSMEFGGGDAIDALQLALFGLRARFDGDDSGYRFLGEPGTGILETIISRPEGLAE